MYVYTNTCVCCVLFKNRYVFKINVYLKGMVKLNKCLCVRACVYIINNLITW